MTKPTNEITGTELTCREICDFLMAFLDGELLERERLIFEKHLAICRECVNYVESYKTTVALSKQTLQDPCAVPQPPVPDDLVKAILAARKKS